jgi:hypothetical protein
VASEENDVRDSMPGPMNDESLERVNAFLAAFADRVPVGEVMELTPAEIGREIGFDALTTARAVRALAGRKRIVHFQDTYRLLDKNPIAADEPGQFRPKRKRTEKGAHLAEAEDDGKPSYANLGRDALSILMELSEEVKHLRSSFETADQEAQAAREQMDLAEQRASSYAEKVSGLEARAEMAEANLRSVMASVKAEAPKGGTVTDTEVAAVLAILRGEQTIGPDQETTTPA